MSSPVLALLPTPHSAEDLNASVNLVSGIEPRYRILAPESGDPVSLNAVKILREEIQRFTSVREEDPSGYPIRFELAATQGDGFFDRPGAYRIRAGKEMTVLSAAEPAGLYYAAATFMQLLTYDGANLSLALANIDDRPDFQHRGLFIETRYGSEFLTLQDWKSAVDYWSRMKYNFLRVGVYGCWGVQYDREIQEYFYLPLECAPELKTPKTNKYYSVAEKRWVHESGILPFMAEQDYFGELARYAKERAVTVSPLFNSYGHNTLLPRVYPEISAKDENGQSTGYSLCTADPRTYERLFAIFDEIVDRYLAPNGIDAVHIGLDEIQGYYGQDPDDIFTKKAPFCRCESCRDKTTVELVIGHIVRMAGHLKSRGMRSVAFYHDILFERNDFDGKEFAEILRGHGLEDTVVVDWWNYNQESDLFGGKETHSDCRGIVKPMTGYFHYEIPNEYESNLCGCARLCEKMGYEGMEPYTLLEYSFDRNYWLCAQLNWNVRQADNTADFYRRYALRRFPENPLAAERALCHMREIMASVDYNTPELMRLDVYNYSYVQPGKPYPRQFPDELFERLLEKKDYYTAYLRETKAHAGCASDFFEPARETGGFFAETWALTARMYAVYSDELDSLLMLHGEQIERDALLRELERLLTAREALMKLVETVRIPATQPQLLRHMSIWRQFLADVIAWVKALPANGSVVLDLTDLNHTKSGLHYFLR